MSAKKGVRLAAREAMQRLNYDPLETLVLVAQDQNTNNDTKLRIAETLLPFMYPKLSNVTVEGEITSNTTADAQANLLRRVLDDPELADAAQKLSLAAASAALETDNPDIFGSIQ